MRPYIEAGNQALQRDILHSIFSRERSPDQSSLELLQILCAPNGMQTFVATIKGRLHFQEIDDGRTTGVCISSSMTPEGRFFREGEEMYWADATTGKQWPCVSMVVTKIVGRALREIYHSMGGLDTPV